MKHRILAFVFAALLPLVLPLVAHAADDDLPQARLTGFKTSVTVDGSTALSWLLLLFLTLVCLAALFKNAKRTHLD